MACQYCGKVNQLVLDNILSGGICDNCYTIVRNRIDATKKPVSVFYKRLQDLGLWNSFVVFMDMFKRDNKQLHFMGVKEDKRRKCPYVLVYRSLTTINVPQVVEISIVELLNRPMIKIVYKGVKINTELFLDKDDKYYAGDTKDCNTDMSWIKEEFGL